MKNILYIAFFLVLYFPTKGMDEEVFQLSLEDEPPITPKKNDVVIYHFIKKSDIKSVLKNGIDIPRSKKNIYFHYIPEDTIIKAHSEKIWKLKEHGHVYNNSDNICAVGIRVDPTTVCVYNRYYRKKKITATYSAAQRKQDYLASKMFLDVYLERRQQNQDVIKRANVVNENDEIIITDPYTAEKRITYSPEFAKKNSKNCYKNEIIIESKILPNEFI